MRCHCTPVRMATINKSTNDKCWIKCGEKGNLVHCWWECRLVQPLCRRVWSILPFDPIIPLLGICSKKSETPIRNNISTPIFIAAQFTIAKIWRQPKCPSADKWIKKLWYLYTMEYYTALKRKELLPFATA